MLETLLHLSPLLCCPHWSALHPFWCLQTPISHPSLSPTPLSPLVNPGRHQGPALHAGLTKVGFPNWKVYLCSCKGRNTHRQMCKCRICVSLWQIYLLGISAFGVCCRTRGASPAPVSASSEIICANVLQHFSGESCVLLSLPLHLLLAVNG